MKRVFIAWIRYDRRTDLMAEHLGAVKHFVHCGQRGNSLQAPLRYLVQGWRTWQILLKERPDTIFVQNPPILCALISSIYARRHGTRFVIDSHSGAFVSRKWRWTLPLHRILSRSALVTIVPNEHVGAIVSSWACRVSVLGFTPGIYPAGEPYPLNGGFNVAVVNTGAEDEPLNVVVEAASQLPFAEFYITGESKRLPEQLLGQMPSNCHLTGYLPYTQYIGLLRRAHIVADLTTRDHTLLMGAYEAVSLGTPLMVSNWPILRQYFSKGTVHVPNTTEGICEGVRQARRDHETLRAEILHLRQELQAEWDSRYADLQQLLQAS